MDHLWASAFSTCGLICRRRCWTEGRRRVRTRVLRTELVAVVVGARTGGWGGKHCGGGWSEVWWAVMGSCRLAWTSGPPHTLLVVWWARMGDSGFIRTLGGGWWWPVYTYPGTSMQAVGGDGWKGV